MNVAVTGGKGYIGSKLVRALEGKGHKVITFDLPENNILSEFSVESQIVSNNIDIVYHLAALAEINYTTTHPDETYEVNITGTNNIARMCAKHNVLLNFTSTSCIYGNPQEPISKEDWLINPSDAYAHSKAMGEHLVKMLGLTSGLKYNILRFGTVYGESLKKEMRADMCIQIFLDKALKGEPLTITGDGNQSRNFIHIDDLIRALVLVAEKGIVGETINLAGNESISINDIAKYAQELGAGEVTYIEERKDDFINQNISLEKAEKLLGWKPEIRFEDGIKQMYLWLKEV